VNNQDEIFMYKAIELAELGGVRVAPNPKVGAVIVHNNEIIGQGYHEYYGGPHAEVNAVNNVFDKELLAESTIYVTLEPCSHFGKTPPCSDLLIHHKFKKVVIGSRDPFHLVNGGGIKKLRDAGIEVVVGVLEDECNFMNRRFLTFHTKKRPYIILKWAETADGFIDYDRTDNERKINWISGEESKKTVHRWRSEEQGILVGWKTVLNDNPQLNVRLIKGKNPVRIILDPDLQSPADSFIFDHSQPTIIYNKKKDHLSENLHYIKLESYNFTSILSSLHTQNIISVLIEGGLFTLNQFIEKDIWDEIRRFKSRTYFHSGVKAPSVNLSADKSTLSGKDQLDIFYNKN